MMNRDEVCLKVRSVLLMSGIGDGEVRFQDLTLSTYVDRDGDLRVRHFEFRFDDGTSLEGIHIEFVNQDPGFNSGKTRGGTIDANGKLKFHEFPVGIYDLTVS